MSPKKRAPFVALATLLPRRFPHITDASDAIVQGLVLVDGATVDNPAARVRADAALRLVAQRSLRGTRKLAGALERLRLPLPVRGAVALDLGAAAGGFTQALLDAGAARVYAVDVGAGQLRGSLRADRRVVSLERTNLARLSPDLVTDPLQLVTMDLSYLAVSDALPQLDERLLAPRARLLALVKPTFELHRARLAAGEEDIRSASQAAVVALGRHGWTFLEQVPAPVPGRRGAVEVFVHAVLSRPASSEGCGS